MSLIVLGSLIVGACIMGAMLQWLAGHQPPDEDTLIAAIDALLPQTQCAQCGFPGCAPYAAAVAAGATHTLCPPGGKTTVDALAELLGRQTVDEPAQEIGPLRATIDEDICIGCALCLPACPVDAIIGAKDMLHTVITAECTGCELCLAPCPVDCIGILPIDGEGLFS